MARAALGRHGAKKGVKPFPCLPPATGDIPEGGIQVASPAEPKSKPIEHAGHAYQDKWLEMRGLSTTSDVDSGDAKKAAPAAANENHASSELKQMLSKDSEDLYDLLELGDIRWRATGDEIKKAFRRISLLYHPDKVSHLGKEALEDSETHFKKVKKAYDVLSDKKRRAAYDSVDEVDDSVPSENSVNDSNFYQRLGPYFDLNARWSSEDRVPSLGDDDTPMEEVHAFYDFWYSFKTWRDFSYNLEHDTDQAECREEKRWMERQNAKHVKARKLEESARIRRLVDTAYKKDPRVRREKDAEKERKEAAKLQRQREREAAVQQEAERLQREKEEQEAKEMADKEERAKAKKSKEDRRQILRRARQKLRGAAREHGLMDTEPVLLLVEQCCSELTPPDIEAAAGLVQDTGGDNVDAVVKGLSDILANPPSRAANGVGAGAHLAEDTEKSAPTAETQSVSPKETKKPSANGGKPVAEWADDEMKRLTKGLSKHPPGTRDRYEKLATFIGTRDADEVLAMVNNMRAHKVSGVKTTGVPSKAPEADKSDRDFERFQRDKKKADVPPPSYEFCTHERPPEASAAPKASVAPKSTDPAPSAAIAANSGSAQKARSKGPANGPPNELAFTPKQQAQLESAMKKHSQLSGSEKWAAVAKDVTGRSPADCEMRYKELVTFFRNKKAKK